MRCPSAVTERCERAQKKQRARYREASESGSGCLFKVISTHLMRRRSCGEEEEKKQQKNIHDTGCAHWKDQIRRICACIFCPYSIASGCFVQGLPSIIRRAEWVVFPCLSLPTHLQKPTIFFFCKEINFSAVHTCRTRPHWPTCKDSAAARARLQIANVSRRKSQMSSR